MANYNYTEGTITRYHIRSPEEVIFYAKLTDEKGDLTQKFRVTYAQWIINDADKGTKVSLRENLNVPYLIRTWEFVKFL
jgi:hypothetical protein